MKTRYCNHQCAFFSCFMFFTLLLQIQSTFAQDTTYISKFKKEKPDDLDVQFVKSYWNTFIGMNSQFDCSRQNGKTAKAVLPETFDSILRPALSNVFVGSNDLTKNTTAASFVQDEKAGTLNLNYAHLTSKQNVWNIGAFSQSTNGIFGIYTNNSWSSNVGLNIGFSKKVGSSLFFCEKKNGENNVCNTKGCEELKDDRKIYISKLLKDYLDVKSYRIDDIRTEISSLKNNRDRLLSNADLPMNLSEIDARWHQLDSINQRYDSIVTIVQTAGFFDKEKAETRLKTEIQKWELTNADIFTGYSIRWLSLTVAISNNSLSLNLDSISSSQKKAYTSKNLAKVIMGGSLNWQRSVPKGLYFFSGGINFGLHNSLDHPTIKNPTLRYDTLSKIFSVLNENGDTIANYADIKADIIALEPNINGACFLFADKQFGFNLRADCQIPIKIQDKEKSFYRRSFNLLFGPVFRLNQESSVSKGTIGLIAGFVDCPFDTHALKYFGFKFNVGIPFNALIK